MYPNLYLSKHNLYFIAITLQYLIIHSIIYIGFYSSITNTLLILRNLIKIVQFIIFKLSFVIKLIGF